MAPVWKVRGHFFNLTKKRMKEEVDELIKRLDTIMHEVEQLQAENEKLKKEKQELLDRIYTLTERK